MIAPTRRWAHATHNGGHSGYRDIDRCDDGRDDHRSWITGYGWNRFRYRLGVRDHSVAVDVSRILTVDRIVDGRDPGRISGAGIVERDGHDESSQQNQGNDKGPSIPTSTCPAAIDMANESIEESSRGPNRRHLRLVSIARRSRSVQGP